LEWGRFVSIDALMAWTLVADDSIRREIRAGNQGVKSGCEIRKSFAPEAEGSGRRVEVARSRIVSLR
jgi:hypothetical protein